ARPADLDKFVNQTFKETAKKIAPDLAGLRVRKIEPSATAVESSTKEAAPKSTEEYVYHGTTPSSAEEIRKTGIVNAGDFTSDLSRAKLYASNAWNPNAEPGPVFVAKRSDVPGLSARGKQVQIVGELGPSGEVIPLKKTPAPKAEAKAGSQTEQLSILTPDGAQPLAEKLGAKVVGSVAKKESERVPNAYGSTKPRDLDLRIEGEYKADETISKMKEAGFEPAGSSLVSPEEVKQSGKQYGKPGWKRAEHFENAAGEKVDLWHDEAEITPQSGQAHPLSPEKAAALAKTRSLNLKHLGDPITEMDPNDARNWIGYDGSQKTIKVYRGVDAKGRTVEPGDFVTTSKESAPGYGPHVVEMDVPASDLRYVQGHKNGDPARVGQGGQVELLYAPKKGVKATPKTQPKNLEHGTLFSEALAGLGPASPKQVFHGTTANVSDISKLSSEFSKEGVAGRGVYLTETPEQAGAYAGPAESGTGGRVLAGSLSDKAKLLDGNAALPDALRTKLQKKFS
ncbi:MAG TPA: hypothetical protein VFQ43_10855, partial [Nitrososphaera sp.]|nr:hypothetical protein [Nitrososphaera sp.]